MAKFIPIADIDGYAKAHKTEGFYSDEQIGWIHERHTEALKRIKPDPTPKPLNNINDEYKKRVDNNDGYYTELKISKNGKVKFNIIFPFREYNAWYKENGYSKTIPPEIYVKCLFKNGASVKYCETWYGAFQKGEAFRNRMMETDEMKKKTPRPTTLRDKLNAEYAKTH